MELQGNVAGLIRLLGGGEGSTVVVTPITDSGSHIADISVDGVVYSIYSPEGFSGDYNDLSNKPTLAAVATSGSYSDLSNKPTLASVATSGSYADLSNKPSINGITLNGAITISSTVDYTTGEEVVGTWFDKPLYRQLYTGLNITPSYNYWSNIIELPTNADKYIGSDIIICESQNGNIDLNHSGLEICFSHSEGYVQAEYNQDINRRPINIISILYTKSTD